MSEPRVSIVVPLFNDAEHVSDAVASALGQTIEDIEVICVDDASTDDTCAVVESFVADERLRLVKHSVNGSAFRARRTGIELARAPFILFLDGDDLLVPEAAEVALARAYETAADVVGFGVAVAIPGYGGVSRLERTLQPRHPELQGEEIVATLFPVGKVAQGHVWRYLFRTELLRRVYEELDADASVPRANDIPVSFLALAMAQKYASVDQKLYRYHLRRGLSGRRVRSCDDFAFYLQAIDSIELIRHVIGRLSEQNPVLQQVYTSARRSVIGNVLRYALDATLPDVQNACVRRLVARAGPLETVLAAADFCRDSLGVLAPVVVEQTPVPAAAEVARVVITTGNLDLGGVQRVAVAQARCLRDDGIGVTLAIRKEGPFAQEPPPGVDVATVRGVSWAAKIDSYLDICRAAGADVIIDHYVLYNEYWPFYALAARAAGIGTIGWLHNFALRPVLDGSNRSSFLAANLPILRTVVVLSPADVSFWQVHGLTNVVYLPNPPTVELAEVRRGALDAPAESRVELAWWGRLQQSTKQVLDLVDVARRLVDADVDFRLTVIGPDGPDMTRSRLESAVRDAGAADHVRVLGALRGRELVDVLAGVHICLMTSVVEGYPLSLVEAQSFGVPIVMYDLPWLAYTKGNGGVVAVPQGDAAAMAEAVARLAADSTSYRSASVAALDAFRRLQGIDFAGLYRDLFRGRLPGEYTPEPSLADVSVLMTSAVVLAERSAQELRRAGEISARQLASVRAAAGRTPMSKAGIPPLDEFRTYRVSHRSRLRRLVSRVVPSTWRHANHLAEKQVRWHSSAFTAVASEQSRVAQSVDQLAAAAKESADRLTAIEDLLRSTGDRTEP